jgi:hypothetical protein
MQFLDLTSLLSLALCSKRLHDDADSEVAWKHVSGKVIVKSGPVIPETTLLRHHKALVREGYDVIRSIPASISARAHELIIKEAEGMTQEAAATILACCNIRSLQLTINDYDIVTSSAVLEAISVNKELRELHINYGWIPFEDFISKLVCECPHIQTLHVTGNNIVPLLRGLKNGHNFSTLCIDDNWHWIPEIFVGQLAAILKAPSLTSLSYRVSHTFSSMNWAEFAELIVEAPSLTYLNLSGQALNKDGVIALCTAAQKSRTLKRLVIKSRPEYPMVRWTAVIAELLEKYGKEKFKLEL